MRKKSKKNQNNIYEIARKAGVSIATISRAMNPETRSKVAPATLKRVDAIIRENAYTPNLAARFLSSSTTKTIGVAFPYLPGVFHSSYYNHILSGVTEYLYDTDYQFKIILLKTELENWDNFNFKAGERIDGLILMHWFQFFSKESMLKKINVPYVVINDQEDNIRTQYVGIDHYLGGRVAANHLYSAGHRRVAILAGPDWSTDSKLRVKGFTEFYQSKGIEINKNLIRRANFLESMARSELDAILKEDPDITAIFACNDQMAFGAISRLKELSMSCPEDISVVGFDDEAQATYFQPPLTTIHVPVSDLAKEAARLLVEYLQKGDLDAPFVGELLLPTRLVERQSVRQI